ncbi:MAG: T9SS type A sorting domain-containing protein [Bacteroidia bacterium]|nr:T9SS type A sorting domain-containing protein [Bacteroidia bacterium]
MKNLGIFCTLILACATQIMGQNPIELENKYWVYRDRFKKVYTQIGEKNGQSQVAASTKLHGCQSTTTKLVNGVEQVVTDANTYDNRINFGDAVIDHGYYMMVLATEYWLLKNKNQTETDQFKAIKNEIYFAVNAMERLDQEAEEFYGQSGILNGFFIRTDQGSDYLKGFNERQNRGGQEWEHQKINWVNGGYHNGPELSLVDTIGGVHRVYDVDSFRLDIGSASSHCRLGYKQGQGWAGPSNDWANEMSQDQVYGMLLGFKALLKWVEPGLSVDPDGPSNSTYPLKNIHQWIKDITHRVMLHVSKTHTSKFGLADEDDWTKIALEECQSVFTNPYRRTDTVFFNPPIIIADTFFLAGIQVIHRDTIQFQLKDTSASSWFSGSSFHTCNIDSIINEIKDKNNVFKEGNYIITNPTNNSNLVKRGAVALPMAYPLKLVGESITGHTYPDPMAKWTDGKQAMRWGSNVIWAGITYATFYVGGAQVFLSSSAVQSVGGVAVAGAALEFLMIVSPAVIPHISGSENADKAAQMVSLVNSNCPLLAPSADMLSLCVIGKPLMVKHKDFWRDLWNRFPQSTILKEATKETLPVNLMHNLAIASGTWSHSDFNDWSNFNGKTYSEILYAMMNDKMPLKPKSHYENALDKAQCEGPWHAGYTALSTVKEAPYNYCLPWGDDNLFAKRGAIDSNLFAKTNNGLDYMLMYNMYRMAEILWWGANDENTYAKRTQCPCKSYPSLQNTNFVRSILEKKDKEDVTVDGRLYPSANAERFVINPVETLASDTIEVFPIYDHYSHFNFRAPNYLLHDATLSGQTWISPPNFTTDTALGWVKVSHDLTVCHSHLKLREWGKLSLSESPHVDFPSKLIVTSGSTLEIEGLGFLEINDNTQVIVEEGATLIIHPQAQIILNGPNAVLHINGKLVLEPNAVFQPTAGPNGFGKVIMENNWGELYVQAKGNNKFVIDAGKVDARSSGYAHSSILKSLGHYHLEARGTYGMHTGWSSHGLDSFIIRNSITFINDGSEITSEAKHTLFSNAFIGGEIHKRSRGVNLYKSQTYMENTTIKYVENGIKYTPINLKKPLILNDVKVQDCFRAVWSQGGAIIANNSSFSYGNYEGDIGLEITGSAGTSTVTKSEITVPVFHNPNSSSWDTSNVVTETGILHFSNNYLVLKETKINDGVIGIQSNDGSIRMQCSRVRSLNTPSEANYGIIKNGGALNLRYGYNLLTDHDFRIVTDRALVSLDKGQNVINKSDDYFLSFINHPKQTLVNSSSYTSGGFVNPSCILATENHWRANSTGTSSPNDFKPFPLYNANLHIVDYNGISTTWHDLGYSPLLNMTQFYNDYNAQNCPRNPIRGNIHTVNHALPDFMMPASSGGAGGINAISLPAMRPTTVNSGHNYGTALVTTIGKFNNDSFVDYGVVLPELKYLSQAVLPDSLFELAYYVYTATQQAYYNSLYDTSLADSVLDLRNQEFGDSMLSYMNTLIEKHDNGEVFWRDLTYELGRDKALVLRSLNRRQDALTVLSNFLTQLSDTLYIRQSNAWSCFIEQEQMVLDSIIPIDSMNFSLCVNEPDFLPHTIQNQSSSIPLSNSKIDRQKRMILYPNPARHGFYIKADHYLKKDGISMFNILGNKVEIPVIMSGEHLLFLDVSNLTPGIYNVLYDSEGQDHRQFKVTILP